MIENYKFGIIGGDSRQIFCAKSMISNNQKVNMFGFDKADIKCTNTINELIETSKCIILPVPTISEDNIIYSPFSSKVIYLDEIIKLSKDKKIFYGMPSGININDDKLKNIKLYNYAQREDFSILNAIPTSEAAIQIALTERNETLYGCKCLVAGFGHIGKILARILKSMGTDVTVSARKSKDIAWINSLNYRSVYTYDIPDKQKYDIVFNTIPYLIFNKDVIVKSTHENSLVIDLASKPGGVDFSSAKELGIKTIHALALPGKYFPKTAGEIIKNVIYNILKEEENDE